MSNVVNSTAATAIRSFLERLYKPIIVWANTTFATKSEVAAITGADITAATEADAHAIWNNYTFTTTD